MEFEALSARRWASVSGWNSSTNFYKEFIYVYRILCTCLYKDCMDGVGVVLGISLQTEFLVSAWLSLPRAVSGPTQLFRIPTVQIAWWLKTGQHGPCRWGGVQWRLK